MLALSILWPLKGWKFALSPDLMAEYHERGELPPERHVYADAAYSLELQSRNESSTREVAAGQPTCHWCRTRDLSAA